MPRRSLAGALAGAVETLKRDVAVARERDPAARSTAEVLLCYPGLHAVWMHRVAHRLYGRGMRLPARLVSQAARLWTGIEIHPGATIGPGLFIDHGMGVVIGETTEIGEDVTIYQGVTLGGTGKDTGKRHPTVHDGVIVGTGARVLGPVEVGEAAKIGAGAIVIKNVPPNSTVVGNPGRPVIVDGQRVDPERIHHPDIEHTRLPDPVAEALACLVSRVTELEQELAALRAGREPPSRADDGDCMPSTRDEIAAILGMNGSADTPPPAPPAD
ncbi:MAG: serine O-acetyltransferase EpsC [Actinomycetota bacterium]